MHISTTQGSGKGQLKKGFYALMGIVETFPVGLGLTFTIQVRNQRPKGLGETQHWLGLTRVLGQLVPTSRKVYLSDNSSLQTCFSDNLSLVVKMSSCQTTCPQKCNFPEYRCSKGKSFLKIKIYSVTKLTFSQNIDPMQKKTL